MPASIPEQEQPPVPDLPLVRQVMPPGLHGQPKMRTSSSATVSRAEAEGVLVCEQVQRARRRVPPAGSLAGNADRRWTDQHTRAEIQSVLRNARTDT